MEEPVFVKCEPTCSSDTDEPSNFENYEFMSEMIPLEQETKSELTQPGPAHENAFQPSADIKEEIFVEQHPVDQMVPDVKEENHVENVAVLSMNSGDMMQLSTVCGSLFSQEEENKSSHSDEGSFVCNVCNTTYRQKTSLLNHILVHSGEKFTSCTEIEVVVQRGESKDILATQSRKKKHIIHTGERSYRCEECNNVFTPYGNLLKHMGLHTGERRYSCVQCNRTFTALERLRSHAVLHTGDSHFCCKICRKMFTRRTHLNSHIVIHTGERPHCCKECNRTFTQRAHLLTHMAIHTGGERAHCCTECNRTFTQRSSLVRHMHIHTRERLLRCDKCTSTFVRKEHLLAHMVLHNREMQ